MLGDFEQDRDKENEENLRGLGKKSILLHNTQFTRRCGMLFDGFPDLNNPRNKDRESWLSSIYNHGDKSFCLKNDREQRNCKYLAVYTKSRERLITNKNWHEHWTLFTGILERHHQSWILQFLSLFCTLAKLFSSYMV